ncbi:unnamed protein product [Rhizoctonia solani]|uniref:USP domain-containing protein n=1 Tax=Rhizoctonia solani TaxID=456999 RepID=A0A8H3HXA5_9AGAM|nr:unnamed protein product [Rhizoctonia solani]
MGKKEKAELAARRKAYYERFGLPVPVQLPPGLTLPPGFVNLGNSCYLNSTLQSLTATPLLQSLITFNPPPDLEHESHLYPSRSPALTNARGPPGVSREWEKGMPISDAFLKFEDQVIRAGRIGQTSLVPRELLGQIGAKYEQYAGYRQQDAHELLRHLLDGMRMEELDMIKKRTPTGVPQHSQTPVNGTPANETPPSINGTSGQSSTSIDSDPPIPFADMVFGGTLASILVCEGCKHISHTYEDFMDLSLSIKPDDIKEKKRDKFKFFHKLRKATTPTPPRTPPPTMPVSQTSLPPSVPFPTTESEELVPPPPISAEGAGAQPQARLSTVQISTEEGHDRDESSSVGARIGRRVSLQGWKRKDKEKSREREKSKERGKEKEKEKEKEKDKESGEERVSTRPSSPERKPHTNGRSLAYNPSNELR